MTGAYVLGIIVGKFSSQQELGLIILLKIEKDLEVRFYYAILSLSVTVSVRMERIEKPPFNAKKIAER